jgi:hypothetical protein
LKIQCLDAGNWSAGGLTALRKQTRLSLIWD